MICTACRHENSAGSSFCEECGARLKCRCPSCGSACAPAAKFCRSCGAPLASRSVPADDEAEGRKVVTILFSDLIGSVSLQERLDPESASRVMERYHRLVRAGVEAHGGTLVQLIGDGVMCAFGVPQVAEDDAIRAVRAGVGIQRAFREFAREESARCGTLGLRVAVNTGEVVPSDDLPAGIGDPLNVAARLQQEAREGDVLIGESTARLVRDLVTLEQTGVFSLKGRSGTVAAYRVVSLDRPAGASATPFVGREDELRRLTVVHEQAVANRRARLAVILGSPRARTSAARSRPGRRGGDSQPRERSAGRRRSQSRDHLARRAGGGAGAARRARGRRRGRARGRRHRRGDRRTPRPRRRTTRARRGAAGGGAGRRSRRRGGASDRALGGEGRHAARRAGAA